MPVKFGLWRVDTSTVRQVPPAIIETEAKLESILEEKLEILGLGRLLPIGRQVITETGKRIDLLAVDDQGDLHLIELKRDRTPREVVGQALEYGFWVQDLSLEAVRELYAKHNDGNDFDSAFVDTFEVDMPDAINTSHHLAVVATGIDPSTEQVISYLRDFNVPINVLFFDYLRDGDREYIARSWLSDPESEPTGGSVGKKQAPWNKRDFFVSVGENEHRNWDDMKRYGFVSAGHGEKYRKAMSNLFPGARVWASIPKVGYVGVGEVAEPAVRVNEFMVELDGTSLPILQAPLEAAKMAENAEDQELSEYLARVRWFDTKDRHEAVWEKGMFANQNVVAKLRQPFTLQRLRESFSTDSADTQIES